MRLGLRVTKVGLWYFLLCLLVGVAATNTGNNALYMALATMLSIAFLSWLLTWWNLVGLEVELDPPAEVFANTPTRVSFLLSSRQRFGRRWMLLVSLRPEAPPVLVLRLDPAGRGRPSGVTVEQELLFPHRGNHCLDAVSVSSLFPLGFFRRALRLRAQRDLLVLPELFPAATIELELPHELGDCAPHRRSGWGHELHALRPFRAGDDPRRIHWKQTARTGNMVFMEREAEESRRISVVLDNGLGVIDGPEVNRFERLVSEAATAAIDYLERGYEVELVTRDALIEFGTGRYQRQAILELLALIGTTDRDASPLLGSDPRAPQLRLGLDSPHRLYHPSGSGKTGGVRQVGVKGAAL